MGTEAFWVPAVLAAVSGGAQYVNQSQANSRQQNAEVQSLQDQQDLRNKATANVGALTQQIAKSNPTQIADQSTSDYVKQLRANAAGAGTGTTSAPQTFGQSTSSLAPSVNGNSRYNTDVANSEKEVQNYGDTQAGEMGQIDAAVRQRQNEGLDMGNLATKLNTLGAQSYSNSFVDQLRAQAAGQQNPFVGLLSNILGNGAKAYAMNAGAPSTGGSVNTSTLWQNPSDATNPMSPTYWQRYTVNNPS